MRHLSLVPTRPPAATPGRPPVDDLPAAAGPLEPVAYVPVKLLLAASGRCSCDECCHAAITPEAVPTPARPARRIDRRPVRNIHLLS
jgi:hypothetical protein